MRGQLQRAQGILLMSLDLVSSSRMYKLRLQPLWYVYKVLLNLSWWKYQLTLNVCPVSVALWGVKKKDLRGQKLETTHKQKLEAYKLHSLKPCLKEGCLGHSCPLLAISTYLCSHNKNLSILWRYASLHLWMLLRAGPFVKQRDSAQAFSDSSSFLSLPGRAPGTLLCGMSSQSIYRFAWPDIDTL